MRMPVLDKSELAKMLRLLPAATAAGNLPTSLCAGAALRTPPHTAKLLEAKTLARGLPEGMRNVSPARQLVIIRQLPSLPEQSTTRLQ